MEVQAEIHCPSGLAHPSKSPTRGDQMKNPIRGTRSNILSAIRRGQRTVLWTPPNLRLGNFLYFWLRAWKKQGIGEDYIALSDASMTAWEDEFPNISRLLISPRDIKFLYQREVVNSRYFQGFNCDFSAEELETFIRDVILPSRTLSAKLSLTPTTSDDLVLNIRRGDYYSVPKFRGMYSFDISSYVRLAMEKQIEDFGTPREVRVISDDLPWCESRLSWLANYAPVEFTRTDGGALEALAAIASAERIVLTNTTFGYWGAYISNVIHSDNHAKVTAPDFFDRSLNSGRPWQLDPRWTLISRIPDGWDA